MRVRGAFVREANVRDGVFGDGGRYPGTKCHNFVKWQFRPIDAIDPLAAVSGVS